MYARDYITSIVHMCVVRAQFVVPCVRVAFFSFFNFVIFGAMGTHENKCDLRNHVSHSMHTHARAFVVLFLYTLATLNVVYHSFEFG